MTAELSELDEHALQLGQVIGNLHSLELSLRLFLHRQEVQADPSKAGPPDVFNLAVGDRVVENCLTNYNTLGTVIANYNQAVESIDSTLAVDASIVELRDAIAHGRVLAEGAARPLRLFKFSQAAGRQVAVTHALVLTDQWFTDQRHRVYNEIQKVQAALEKIN